MTLFFMNLFDVFFPKFMYTLRNYNLRLLFLLFTFGFAEKNVFCCKQAGENLDREHIFDFAKTCRCFCCSKTAGIVVNNLLIEKINRETFLLFVLQ